MTGSINITANALYDRIKATLTPVFGEQESGALALTLLENRLGLNRTDVLVKKSIDFATAKNELLEKDVQRVLSQEPIQYVLRSAEFYGRQFQVEPGVLIPRPETEELVNLIVTENNLASPRILDIGTGSGCIAISLAAEIPKSVVRAWDVSKEALNIAKRNAERLDQKLLFENVDILSSKIKGSDFDIIVSNPPYVLESEKGHIQPNVLDHEPDLALFVEDNDPLIFYSHISEFGAENLVNGGHLYFEINEVFGDEIKSVMESHGFIQVEVIKDMNGKDRMARGQWIPQK